jgi:hypothetical protein
MRTKQRANRTDTVERIGERFVYKGYWNTLRAGKIMRRDWSRAASKKIGEEESQAETKYWRKKSQTNPEQRKDESRELGTDRDFFRSAIYTVGGDRSEGKGNFLDGGSNVSNFFTGLRTSIRNLMQERSAGVVCPRMDLRTLEASPLAF